MATRVGQLIKQFRMNQKTEAVLEHATGKGQVSKRILCCVAPPSSNERFCEFRISQYLLRDRLRQVQRRFIREDKVSNKLSLNVRSAVQPRLQSSPDQQIGSVGLMSNHKMSHEIACRIRIRSPVELLTQVAE